MIGPVLKFVWHRKRLNALLIVEIFFSFLVAFVVATLGVELAAKYRRPLGFSFEDVWSVSIDVGPRSDDQPAAGELQLFTRLLQEASALPRVEAAAGSVSAPYELGGMFGAWDLPNGGRVEVEMSDVTDGLRDVLGLEIVRGRWFEPADEALSWRPIVVDLDLARKLYGDEDPIGKAFRDRDEGTPEERVVGVMSGFRKGGELSLDHFFAFRRARLLDPQERVLRRLLLRVKPGTPPAFEEELVRRLQATAPQWSFQAQSLVSARETSFRVFQAPLLAGGLIASFLMIMVGLGLSGVLWQNVVRRTREIGLRRAVGATRGDVYRQILLEILILTGFGLVLGTALVVQIPMLTGEVYVSGAAFAKGLAFAAGAMLALAAACGLYPAWLASRVPPADALRHE
jgi:putative ABC transport system permease protein